MRHNLTLRARSAWTCALLGIVPSLSFLVRPMQTAGAQDRVPTATLVEAPLLTLPGDVDSNSPAVWGLVSGQRVLHVLTSFGGQPSVSSGLRLMRMMGPRPVEFLSHPGYGVWMEAIVADAVGTFYGFYHNEIPAEFCGRPDRAMPRIGAARSRDRGRTWDDLGIILEAPPAAYDCSTLNAYFVGGVGDLSVALDRRSQDLYLFFSQYSRLATAQGIAVARLPWGHRDAPVGKLDVWVEGVWLRATSQVQPGLGELVWRYPAGTPLVQPSRPWHDDDPQNDAFWGAAVHWNTHLGRYVMLLNRTKDDAFGQEGIYISFAPALDDPRLWSAPQPLLLDGDWYPQVIGLEAGQGTDKLAGARARFFMSGRSEYFIDFGYE